MAKARRPEKGPLFETPAAEFGCLASFQMDAPGLPPSEPEIPYQRLACCGCRPGGTATAPTLFSLLPVPGYNAGSEAGDGTLKSRTHEEAGRCMSKNGFPLAIPRWPVNGYDDE